MTILGAVLGSPVSHSLSPSIHLAAFSASGREGDYIAIDCQADAVEEHLNRLQHQGAVGVSITTPLKESVIPFLGSLSDDAHELRAVNCVLFEEGNSIGYNTDGEGCCDALVEQGGAVLSGARAVVLGAGGTARAVTLSLLRRGASVIVVNRTTANANLLVSTLQKYGDIAVGVAEDICSADILVNTTSVGMNSDVMAIPTDVLHSKLIVLDAVYSPLQTALLVSAADRGAAVVDGLWMLIQQARHQQMLWFGEKPSTEVMRIAAEQELASRRK